MSFKMPISRRSFICLAGAAAGSAAAVGCSGSDRSKKPTAVEFLDRQHGVLCRAVSILEEIKGGMDARMDLPPELMQGTLDVVEKIVLQCHQKLEEKYIYPAFESANKMGGLVGVLREQHGAGAQLTQILRRLAEESSARDLEKRRTLSAAIHQFGRMYRAHSHREDTVLFPAIHEVVTPKAYEKLNRSLQSEGGGMLGEGGFGEAVQKLAGIEEALGIGDLAAFTPRIDDLR